MSSTNFPKESSQPLPENLHVKIERLEKEQLRLKKQIESLQQDKASLSKKLEQVNKDQIEYLQNVSHQLVAPLNAMKWLYVVSEIGTIRPRKMIDTLMAMPLLPGGSIILPSSF